MAVPFSIASAQTQPVTQDPTPAEQEAQLQTEPASNVIQNGLCAGANMDASSNCSEGGMTQAEADARINQMLRTIINLFSLVVGVAAVLMIIVGGFRYITSGGDSGNVTSAKNTILYAIIGLIIVALSQFVVRFVLTKVTQT